MEGLRQPKPEHPILLHSLTALKGVDMSSAGQLAGREKHRRRCGGRDSSELLRAACSWSLSRTLPMWKIFRSVFLTQFLSHVGLTWLHLGPPETT